MKDNGDPDTSSCLEGSYFSAYKCWFNGAASMEAVGKIVFTHMTMIDNKLGVAASS